MDLESQAEALWQAPVGVALFDTALSFVRVNDAFAALTNRAAGDHAGRPLREVQPGAWPALVALLERVRDTGEAREAEVAFGPRRERRRVHAYPVRRAGRLEGIGVVATAVPRGCESCATAAEVERSRAQLSAVFDAVADGISVCDMRGTFVLVNEAQARIDGFDDLEEMKRHLSWFETVYELREADGRLLRPEEWPISKVLRGESVVDWTLHGRRTDTGREWLFSFSGEPVRDPDGTQVLAVVVTRDVTDRHRAQAALHASEARLRAVIENLAEGLVVVDPAGPVLQWNRAALDLFGYADGDELLASYGSLAEDYDVRTPGGERLPFERWPLARALRGESFRDEELLVTRRSRPGWERIVACSGSLLGGSEGRPALGLLSARDVTDRRRAEQALRDSEARLRRAHELLEGIAENTQDFIAAQDAEGRYLAFNRAYRDEFERIYGLRLEIGTRMAEALAHLPDQLEKAAGQWGRALAGEAFTVTEEFGDPRLGRATYELRFSPIRDRDGRLAGAAHISRDVTERKRAQDALAHSEEQLRLADRRKNEFLAMLSHELRNPLTPIRNGVHLLAGEAPGSERAKRAVEIIDRQSRQLARLIDDLLDVTRISRGKIRLRRERVELNALVRHAADDHADVFARAGVALELAVPDERLHVEGDPTRVSQVLGNLLSNAAKFTSAGGRARLSLERGDDAHAVVRVRDDGAGIAPETLPHLFEQFVQADDTLERSRGGLGLGLALVKRLVEMHGGSVHAASAGPGLGAELTVRLPLEAAAHAPAPASAATPSAPAALRVLLVEDNLDVAHSLKEVLELGGHDVELAATGPDGIAAARRFAPDVVLCDLGLPGLDGYAVAKALRAEPAAREAHLVALSGYALREDVERALAAGFDRHLAKPPDLSALDALLADAAQRRAAGGT